jgi:hypothetical protein
MPITERPTPEIELVFQGLIVTRIQDGSQQAEIGVLREALDHPLRIGLLKMTELGPDVIPHENFDLTQDITIEVNGSTLSGIKTFTKDGFSREKPESDKNDFGWVIDLEGSEFFNGPLTVDPSKIEPVIRVNNAEFFAKDISKNKVDVASPGGTMISLGRVALTIGANIYLDQPGSSAVLKNGSKEILTMKREDNTKYRIVFDCDCRNEGSTSDFSQIYQAVGVDIPPSERLDLVAQPPPPTPAPAPAASLDKSLGGEIRCTFGNLGQTAELKSQDSN